MDFKSINWADATTNNAIRECKCVTKPANARGRRRKVILERHKCNPAFRLIFQCYLLSPFVTLSAGGVGLSFKSGSEPRLYDQGKSPDGESHTVAPLRAQERNDTWLGANRIDHQKANERVDHDLAPRALPCKLAQNDSG